MPDLGWWWWLISAGAVLLLLLLAWRPLRGILQEIHMERAREMFALQREHLEAKFMDVAAATGKPRGLYWRDCDWTDGVSFARDRVSGEMNALVGVTIQFEAIPGGVMEDEPAVANLRNATAVFYFQKGQWHTNGRAIFNMNPDEALKHFEGQYEKVEMF
jgi:hypothetical protein